MAQVCGANRVNDSEAWTMNRRTMRERTREQSQPDCVLQPKVGVQRLPWVRGQKLIQRQRRCGPGKALAGTGMDGSQPRCGRGGLAGDDPG